LLYFSGLFWDSRKSGSILKAKVNTLFTYDAQKKRYKDEEGGGQKSLSFFAYRGKSYC
jgi:hypothetical protein